MKENQTDITIFQILPAKPQGRFDILISIMMGIFVTTAGALMAYSLHGQKNYDFEITLWTLSAFYVFISILNLSSRKTQFIILDQKVKALRIGYLTMFKTENELLIPLEKLSYIYKIKLSKGSTLKFRLQVFNDNKRVYIVDTNDDGYNKGQFDQLIKTFENEKITRRH
jgi:hypothetical protein